MKKLKFDVLLVDNVCIKRVSMEAQSEERVRKANKKGERKV